MIKNKTAQSEIDENNTEYMSICKREPKVGLHKSIEGLKKAEDIEYVQGIGGNDQSKDRKLNLKIARKIITEIEGELEIDSAPEKNIFTISIPNNKEKYHA